MEAMMDGIGKHAAFYRAYLPHDRSLVPVAVALGAIVALWLSLYWSARSETRKSSRRKRAPRPCSSADL